MKMLLRLRERMLSRLSLRFLYLVLPVVILAGGTVLASIVALRREELQRNAETRIAELVQQTAGLLAFPTWNLDRPLVDALLNGLVMTEIVACAQMEGVAFFPAQGVGRQCPAPATTREFRAEIVWQNENGRDSLGELVVWAAVEPDSQTMWTTFSPLLALLAALLIAFVVAAMIAFARTILNPLHRVGDSLRRYGRDGERARVDWSSDDELGEFIATYNGVLSAQEQAEDALQQALARSEQQLDELMHAQQSLVQAEKMAALGTLTAGVAHEINNPTNFADGAVQSLQEQHRALLEFLLQLAGDDAPPEVRDAFVERFRRLDEMTALARDGHRRIRGIVGDLRQFTRLDEAERKCIRIAEPIQSTVNLIRTRFDRIAFELDLMMNPEIECHPARLGQVFMNLIVNACEAVTEVQSRTGWVKIATAVTDTDVVVHIHDNGSGMDEATRKRVFEPFFTTKAIGKGTGLGLAIAFGIVQDHDGTIEVESQAGLGTWFKIRLPRSPLSAVPPAAPAASTSRH